jgi:hypothetical protein
VIYGVFMGESGAETVCGVPEEAGMRGFGVFGRISVKKSIKFVKKT